METRNSNILNSQFSRIFPMNHNSVRNILFFRKCVNFFFGFLVYFLLHLPSIYAGNLFVVDSSSQEVKQFDADTGNFLGVVTGTTGNLETPLGIAFHPGTGNIFIANGGNNDDIRQFDPDSGTSSGSFGETSNFLLDPLRPTFHPLTHNLFVSDSSSGHGDVREFDNKTGDFISSFGETAERLEGIRGLTFNPIDFHLLVSNSTSIMEFEGFTGKFIRSFGSPSLALGLGLVVHPVTGNILVADFNNQDVREFEKDTGVFLGTFGETGTHLISPEDVMFHPETGNLLVTDFANGDVREFEGTTGAFLGVFGETGDHLTHPDGLMFRPDFLNLPLLSLPSDFPDSPNSQRVVSPYWQSDSATYTFVSVSHPSLSGMSSQIGLQVNALVRGEKLLFGTAEFTIQRNNTQKVFIVGTNHPVLNPAAFPNDTILAGNDMPMHGQLIFQPLAEKPETRIGNADGSGFPDITHLNIWGAVVVQATSTGFAMEFIGDASDSRAVTSGRFSGVN